MQNNNWMQDVSEQIYRNIREDKRTVKWLSHLCAIVVMAILIGITMHSCVEAVVMEAELREQYEPPPVYVHQTYKRPAAYRMASPTMAEMEHLHGMLRVMEVRR